MTALSEEAAAAAPEKTRRGGVRAVTRNLGWMFASRGVQVVLSLFYIGIATRTLGLVDFGRFALITGASQALITFVGFPTWQIVVQYGVTHLIAKDEAALGRLLRACALLDLLAATAGAIIVTAIIALFARSLGITPDLVGYVILFSVVQLLSLRSTALGIMRLRDQYARAAWADSATPIIRFAGVLLAWWLLPTVGGFLIAWSIAEIGTAVAFWRMAAIDGDLRRLWRARLDREQVMRENPRFLRFAFSANASVTLGLSENQLPLLFVGAYAGPAAAGAFRLAFQLAQALSKLAAILTRAAFPELVRAIRTSGPKKIGRMLVKILLASSAVAVPILVIVIAAGDRLLALVGGKAYASAYPVLVWLAVAGCLDLATVGFEPVMMALHRAGTAFAARSVSTLALIVAMVLLTPTYGAVGAAMALLVGSIVAETLLAGASIRAVRSAVRHAREQPAPV